MINIRDPNAADKIIQLERALGWCGGPENFEGPIWEEGLRRDIADIQRSISDKIHIRFDDVIWAKEGSGTCIRRGWTIYGQGGWDRYLIEEDGDIGFIKLMCTHMNEAEAVRIALEMGFSVV